MQDLWEEKVVEGVTPQQLDYMEEWVMEQMWWVMEQMWWVREAMK